MDQIIEPIVFIKVEGEDESEYNGSPAQSDGYDGYCDAIGVNHHEGVDYTQESKDETQGFDQNLQNEKIDAPNGKCSEDSENELEQNVAHFLAETSSKRKRQKNSKAKISGGMLKCSRCPASFRYKSTLSYHMKSDCGTKIIIDKELIKKGSSKEAAVCDICKKQLCSRTSLMVHMRRHTGERPFECAHCGKSFFQKAHLRDHMRSLHSPGQFLCRVCNATYPDRATLDLHLRTHFPANSYPCQECGKVYTCKSGLTGHMGAAHSKGPKREFPCGACPAVLGRWRELLEHRRREHAHGATCQQCGLCLPNLSRWQAHLRKAHPPNGGPPPTCPVCFKEFTTRYTLDLHIRSHTGERPYACHICGRAFARKSTHDVHLTIHTGRKDYVCSHCGEAFNRKSKLDIHLADHFNMTVQCSECDKVFKCKSYLLSHLKVHRISGSLKCEICARVFKNQRELYSHRKITNGSCQPSSEVKEEFVSCDDMV